MRRRLYLWINHLNGWESAEDYESACSAKYVLNDDNLWDAYTIALNNYIEAFENIRKTAKRESITEEDIKHYEREEE